MYLLDKNVVSELRKHKPHGGVVGWLNSVGDDLIFLSAVTMGEVQAGIERRRSPELSSQYENGGKEPGWVEPASRRGATKIVTALRRRDVLLGAAGAGESPAPGVSRGHWAISATNLK